MVRQTLEGVIHWEIFVIPLSIPGLLSNLNMHHVFQLVPAGSLVVATALHCLMQDAGLQQLLADHFGRLNAAKAAIPQTMTVDRAAARAAAHAAAGGVAQVSQATREHSQVVAPVAARALSCATAAASVLAAVALPESAPKTVALELGSASHAAACVVGRGQRGRRLSKRDLLQQ